jgi:Zn-dependent M28 family amino/carboxypeptidase
MNLDAELLGEQPVFNTIATIKGTEKPDEYVVLSAHFDSWDGSSGATDNGTGTIMVMEAMRILKRVLPNPKRTIIAGHWSGEEEGENGSRAFTEDHPEVIKGLQALFNQDNGTGRIVRISGAGLPDAARHMSAWVQALPDELRVQAVYQGPGRPAGGGSDDFAFSCYGTPAFGLGALNWNYGDYTWHTNRDTYDKIVFDDLKGNAAIAATLAYMASEDPTFVTRERVDLTAIPANPSRRGGASTAWPECQKAHRTTSPRLR